MKTPYANGLVSTKWLAAHRTDPDILIFDCTTRLVPDEKTLYRAEPARADFQAGHIPGAQFIDVQADLSDNAHRYKYMLPTPESFSAAMTRFGVRPGVHIVVYSSADPWWATRVWWLLRVFGFDNVSVLDGGLQKWRREHLPLESGKSRYRPAGQFVATLRPHLIAEKNDVLGAIGNEHICILSARQPAQFAGAEGNNYGRAGRITGSHNLPAASLFDPTSGTYLPLDRLRDAVATLNLDNKKVIAYCGHGVAASADVFVLTLLGHPDVALYDASLSEWADADDLPMTVG
ncbi:sulfurtransferase [Pectobacterium wasabiae]|uniref:Sulfurtransferase n=1 Tax=Pectobacterium wasabiae TaxID=55208 RepID=A0AAW3EIW7_9GAMM|nr:sulfurtransferase [Pectobacterium wasabiae]AOR64077.1 sulfurtransferase [Pectobacterium wasabiae CFBP 3304]EJS94475.1 3-mercaptopyruvate sulfurtransferase [Pectobacterium wasabiae CFBP 3304]KFX08697.1 sulfurtransferase [Pectobacterium wasabiae]KGA28724.1 sulfurtransferase [Pectobacterium wasabiae]